MGNTSKPEAVARKLKGTTAEGQMNARATVYGHYYSAFVDEKLKELERIPAESGSRLIHKIPSIRATVEADPADFAGRMALILAIVQSENIGIEIKTIADIHKKLSGNIHDVLSSTDIVQLQAIADRVGAETGRFPVVNAIELKLDRGWESIPNELRPKHFKTSSDAGRELINVALAELGNMAIKDSETSLTEEEILSLISNAQKSRGEAFETVFGDINEKLGFECAVNDVFPSDTSWNNLRNATGLKNLHRRLTYQAILETYLILNTQLGETPVRKVLGVFPFEIETEGPGVEDFDDIFGASERAREWLEHVKMEIVPKMGPLAVEYTDNLINLFADRDTQIGDIQQAPSKHATSKFGTEKNASLVDAYSSVDFAAMKAKIEEEVENLPFGGPLEMALAQVTRMKNREEFLRFLSLIEMSQVPTVPDRDGGAA